MKKITMAISLTEEQKISISNGEKEVKLDSSNGTLKASEVFTLFDNGSDVAYECNDVEKVPEEGKNLTSEESMFNDALDLINSIITSINTAISDMHKEESNISNGETKNDADEKIIVN